MSQSRVQRSRRRSKRTCPRSGPDLFDHAQEREQLTDPAVRRMLRYAHSPAVAAVLAQAAGLCGRPTVTEPRNRTLNPLHTATSHPKAIIYLTKVSD